ncbi:hypothetical protein [Psychrobacillus lasiicapitis]|uniref:Uncharacterized protein n=1 Tax=Psychrobacillus lasiicapitis TaxID=1636719 RepID=A0A544T1V9_9BACI|nr:hypothetical protein [Psychrobacillus lasiicapitis]TQR11418.1 hypothetical protein FG382_15850 [Psychrobacillus lasiicapitis]GGA40714.1 hypothetical protein GCM10011384_32960 [Psychrobacillus lasiicapitis]
MKYEWMIDEVSSYLYGYLKDGVIQIDSFIHKAHFSIDRLQDLLKLRFIKNKRTLIFMNSLEGALGSIKSSTDSNTLESYHEVRGEILWEETLQRRLQTNPKDSFRFITRETERTFNTDENLVLKELLVKLYNYCFDDQFLNIFASRPWYEEVLNNRDFVEKALYQNVYVSRIVRKNVSDRTINKVKSHRKKIYREAAHLLFFIRKIEQEDFTPEQLTEVLHEFFIIPTNEDVLFELYWIVQILKQQNNVTYYLMDGTNSKVASWADGEFDVHLYHNSTGSKFVKFQIHIDELADSANPYLIHKMQSIHQYRELAKTFFNVDKSAIYWGGRPDILIEKVDRKMNRLDSLVIGEIKNTQKMDYVSKGLSELIDYMYLVKNDRGQYLVDTNVQIKGLLCVGAIELKEVEKEKIKVATLFTKDLLI